MTTTLLQVWTGSKPVARFEHGDIERLAKKLLDFLTRHRKRRSADLMLGIVEADEKNDSVARQDARQRFGVAFAQGGRQRN